MVDRVAEPDPDFEEVVRNHVLGMPAARLYGFSFGSLRPGAAEIVQPYREELSQGGGLFQGGVIGALADFAAGSAAATLLPAGWVSATVDYTVKIVAPGKGERLVARGRVVDPGRTLTVAAAEIYAVADGAETLCATALVTMRNHEPRPPRGTSGCSSAGTREGTEDPEEGRTA